MKEKVFTKLFEEAEIAKFTPTELKEYEDSLKAYRDVKNSIDTALEKGREEGMAKGMAKGMEKGMAKGLAKGLEKGREEGMEKKRYLQLAAFCPWVFLKSKYQQPPNFRWRKSRN